MKQCNYTVQVINGVKVFVSNKSGKVLTGAAKASCERAEAKRQAKVQSATDIERRHNEAEETLKYVRFVLTSIRDNSKTSEEEELNHLCEWYEENADIITAEQEAMRNTCNNYRDAKRAVLVGKPTQAKCGGKTNSQVREIVKKLIARRRSIRLNRERNTVSRTNKISAVNIVCRRILGGKAMREGRKVRIVFMRKIITLKDYWTSLPPRANGKVGGVRCNDGKCRAWVMVKFNHCTIWVLASVSNAWEQITAKHHNTPGPKGGEPKPDYTKLLTITGWAFNLPTINRLMYALGNEEICNILCNHASGVIALFINRAIKTMGWNYNAARGTTKGAVEAFLEKRYNEPGIVIPENVPTPDMTQVLITINAVIRCMTYALQNTEQHVVANKNIRSALARLCYRLLKKIQERG